MQNPQYRADFQKLNFFSKFNSILINKVSIRILYEDIEKNHFKKYRQKVTIDARVHFYQKLLE